MGRAADKAEAVSADALDALRWHWGDAYRIGVYEGEWQAWRKDDLGGALCAPGPDELNKQIVDDYTFRPVRRDLR
ncbi:MAG TPA: hypothetical protein VF070_13230 [Streptosporangiaceae bacterium]